MESPAAAAACCCWCGDYNIIYTVLLASYGWPSLETTPLNHAPTSTSSFSYFLMSACCSSSGYCGRSVTSLVRLGGEGGKETDCHKDTINYFDQNALL